MFEFRPFCGFALRVVFMLQLCAFSSALLADQVIMKNGDIISGKVVSLDKKKITIDPPYTGQFEIKLDAVQSIQTDEPLEFEWADGQVSPARFVGAENGHLLLEIEEEQKPLTMAELEKAYRPQPYYRRESAAEGLLTINEGNTVNQSAAFKFDTLLRLGKHRQYASVLMQRDENNGVETKRQDLFRHEYNWMFQKRWSVGTTASYERDPIRDLSYRYTFGALAGHDFVDDEQAFFSIRGGLGYTSEELGDEPSQGPVGLWELNFRMDMFSDDLEVYHKQALTYQHYGDKNYIVKTDTGLKVDILWGIYATASYQFNYEAEPAPTKLNKDSTMRFGMGVKF